MTPSWGGIVSAWLEKLAVESEAGETVSLETVFLGVPSGNMGPNIRQSDILVPFPKTKGKPQALGDFCREALVWEGFDIRLL